MRRLLSSASAVVLVSVASVSHAAPRLRWAPDTPGDGRAFLIVVEGLSAKAKLRGRFLEQEFGFAYDPDARAHLALAAVPLGTRARAHGLAVTGAQGKRSVNLRAKVKTGWVTYPLSEVRLRPQKGAVKKGERPVDGREKIKEALARRTEMRFWRVPFHRPLTSRVTEAFGVRRLYMKMKADRVVKKWRGRHMGLDLDGDGGEPIGAVADGVVATLGHFFGTGKCVYLDHGHGFFTSYFHMSEIGVRIGQKVKRGDVLGKVGATGQVTGPHLHLAAKVNGITVDPALLLELKP